MLNIVFFGALREWVDCDQMTFPLEQPMTVQDVVEQLVAESGQWQPICNHRTLCAINQEMAGFEDLVRPGNELAFFPPVTGG